MAGTSANFGQIQGAGAPNITGSTAGIGCNAWGVPAVSGAFTIADGGSASGQRNPTGTYTVTFNASRSSALYGAAPKEIRPRNRNYLPIIKY